MRWREATSLKNNKDEKIAAGFRARSKQSSRIIEEFRRVAYGAANEGVITEQEVEEADSMLDSLDMRQRSDYLKLLLEDYATLDGVRRVKGTRG